MSLINQVLKDLEQRQMAEAGDGAAILQQVRYVPAPNKVQRHWRGFGWLAVVVLLCLGIAGIYYWRNQHANVTIASSGANRPAPQTEIAMPNQISVATPVPVATPAVAETVTTPTAEVSAVATPVIPAPIKVKRKSSSHTRTESAPVLAKGLDETKSASDSAVHKQAVQRTAAEQTALLYQQAYDLIGQQRWREAETQLRAALLHDAGQHRLRELLVGLYIKTGRWVEADTLLAEGLTLTPLHQPLVKLRARTLMQLNQDQRAMAVLTQYAPPLATDPEHYALLAALRQRQGSHAAAVQLYRQLLEIHPHAGVWWVGLGISLEALQQNSEAQAAYQHARSSGNLTREVSRYTDNRLRALQDLGLGTE